MSCRLWKTSLCSCERMREKKWIYCLSIIIKRVLTSWMPWKGLKEPQSATNNTLRTTGLEDTNSCYNVLHILFSTSFLELLLPIVFLCLSVFFNDVHLFILNTEYLLHAFVPGIGLGQQGRYDPCLQDLRV